MARFRPAAHDDAGFSLLESVIALAIAAVVFTALASAMVSSMKAVLVGRSVQQSGDVGSKALDSMRALGYDGAAMRTADLTTNETLDLSAHSYDPARNISTGSGTEPLVLDDAGSVYPHVSTVVLNATTYTVREYVTKPADATLSTAKRLTVVVSWTQRGAFRSRTFSTLLVDTRRGLPLPDYKFASNGAASACVSPGGRVVLGFTLTNNGARDSWTLSTTGGTLTWSYYLDDGTGSPGTYDTDDSAMPSSGGTPTVGPIDPTKVSTFWAVADVSGGASASNSTITFRATSVAQPTYYQDIATAVQVASLCTGTPTPTPTATPTATTSPSASPTPTATAPTQPTSCTATVPSGSPGSSATNTSYYLSNGSTNTANTTASSPLTLKRLTAPVSTTLWDYATDLASSSAGRYVATSGTTLATSQEWRYQFGTSTKLVGSGSVALWAAPVSGLSTTTLSPVITVKRLNSAGVSQGTITTSTITSAAWGCTGMKPFGVTADFGGGSGTTFSATDYLSVTVTIGGSASLLGYDTTTFPAQVILPVKSGGT